MRYHAETLSKDVSSRVGCISGRANIAAIKGKIARSGIRDPELLTAVEQLAVYFEELVQGLGENGFKLAYRQEIGGEFLDEADAAVLAQAEARKVRTTINKQTAKRLAKLIGERARGWSD